MASTVTRSLRCYGTESSADKSAPRRICSTKNEGRSEFKRGSNSALTKRVWLYRPVVYLSIHLFLIQSFLHSSVWTPSASKALFLFIQVLHLGPHFITSFPERKKHANSTQKAPSWLLITVPLNHLWCVFGGGWRTRYNWSAWAPLHLQQQDVSHLYFQFSWKSLVLFPDRITNAFHLQLTEPKVSRIFLSLNINTLELKWMKVIAL